MPKSVTTNNKPHILAAALVAVGILLIPLVAMLFTSEVKWGPFDFIVMGTLIFGTGLLIDLAARKTGVYRSVVIFGIVLVFLWVWAELAVGIFTNLGS